MHAIEMRHINKRFGKKTANVDISFTVEKGEIHSLLGENGAGKTTLMNILFGMYKADSGTIRINEKEVRITSPLVAIGQGISMVHQHFMLVDNLTVTENIVLGQEPTKLGGLYFDRKGAFQKIQEIADRYHLKVDSRAMVGDLSVGVKQRVEILKALYKRSDILILDEPTAVLTPSEVDDLFLILKELKKDGKTIVIITHKLKETMAIADSVTVLRKGELIARLPIGEVNEEKLAELMVGRLINLDIERKPLEEDRPIRLLVEGLTYEHNGKNVLENVSLSVKSGEILGVAGVEGNGQTELLEAVTGILKGYQGTISIDGNDVTQKDARTMLRYIGHIPEDRKALGFVKNFLNWENLILGYHRRPEYMRKGGIMRIRDIRKMASEAIEEYDIRTEGADQPTGDLSGGNQQKLIIGRVLRHQNGVVIAAQPTRGVDIGAIEYIYSQLLRLRDEGAAILLVSADLDEIVRLSDRIAVIYEGRIVEQRYSKEFTETELGSYMLGSVQEAGA